MKLLPPLLALAAFTTLAQATEVLPPVSTTLKRDSSALPYARINDLLGKLSQYGEDLFRMDFKVDRDRTKVPVESVRMAVAGEEAYLPIKIEADGSFKLPHLPQEQADKADLATNVAKGQLAVRGTLELNVPPSELDMAKVRQIMRVSGKLKSELLPWYLRWLFPRVAGVLACAPESGLELEWREDGQLLGLPLPTGERDPEARKDKAARQCSLLTGQERWPDSARLVPLPGTHLSVKLGD